MDLIIKPTQRCNFKCTFCSSTAIAESNNPQSDLELSKIKRFLARYPNTQTIIVNGGDPLMMEPAYYFEIIEYIREHKLPAKLNFCTNLWDYYLHPDKWRDLFMCPEVGIGTSFEFSGRKISANQELTLELFLTIVKKFESDFGFVPSFVSVVSNANKHRAQELVQLAKQLGVECKLNPVLSSGRSDNIFTTGDVYHIYLDLYEAGLADHEFNTKQLLANLKNGHQSSICPQNRRCDEGIRNLQPKANDYEYGSCGAFGDDQLYPIDFESEMNGASYRPLQSAPEVQYLKEECLSCPNFNICNGCYKTVNDLKKLDKVEESCKKMKDFRQRASALGLT